MQAARKYRLHLEILHASDYAVNQRLGDLRLFKQWLRGSRYSLNVRSVTEAMLSAFASSSALNHRESGRPRKTCAIARIKKSVIDFFAFLETAGVVNADLAGVLAQRLDYESPRGSAAERVGA